MWNEAEENLGRVIGQVKIRDNPPLDNKVPWTIKTLGQFRPIAISPLDNWDPWIIPTSR